MNNIRNFMLAIAIMFTSIFGGCEDDTEDQDPPQVRENDNNDECGVPEDPPMEEEESGTESEEPPMEEVESGTESEDPPMEEEDPVPGWQSSLFLSYIVF